MTPSRRTVLRGLGVTLALPWLPSLTPRAARATESPPPRRLVVFSVPNGMPMDAWTPDGVGATWTLPPLLAPLERHRGRFSVISGLDNRSEPGIEPHASLSVCYLTGHAAAPWTLPPGTPFRSIDQVIAEAWAGRTPVRSLELGSEAPVFCSEATSGQLPSCLPYHTLSWADAATPLPRELSPRRLFSRLFGAGTGHDTVRRRHEGSILDVLAADAARLQARAGAADRARLEQHLTAIRELELRLAHAAPAPDGACGGAAEALDASGLLDATSDVQGQVTAMSELLAVALQCDQTRVATYMLGNERSNRPYPHLGIPGAHHALSHHAGSPTKLAQIEAIGVWEVEQVARFLDRLAATPEGDGTLLDHTLVLFGSPLADPDTHAPRDVPTLVAGGGGLFRLGEHVALGSRPIADLHVTVARRLGLDLEAHGTEGTGEIAEV